MLQRRLPVALLILACLLAPMSIAAHAAETELKPWRGNPAPPFTLDALSGERIDLAQFRGRVVVLHFFATWCEPCRAEMTALQALLERMRDRPVTLLAIDVGEVEASIRRFFASQPVDFAILLDRDRNVSKAWQVYALPTTLLLDGNLVPRFIAEGDFDWSRQQVDALLTRIAQETTTRDRRSALSENDKGG
jgi:peroxiredoxin